MRLETINQNQENVSAHKLINSQDVRELFGGVSKMTLHRWQKNPELGFPKPIFISRRRFWREAELIDFIENQTRKPN